MSKFFITDPCYTMSHDNWSKLLDDKGFEPEDWIGADTDFGKIINASQTANGDGEARFSDGSIGVDSGTVAIIEVSDDFEKPDNFGVVRSTLEAATKAFEKGCRI